MGAPPSHPTSRQPIPHPQEVRSVSSLRKGRKLLVVLFAFTLLAAACGDDDDGGGDEGTDTTAPTTVTDVPEGGTVTYASDQEPTGWNTNTGNDNLAALNYMTILVYPQAFDTTPDFEVVMNEDLLTSAEQTSDDPQVIEYEINPDATWSDGEPITGKDFIYNWKLQNGKVDADVGESDPEAAEPDDATIPDVASTTGYENIESVEGEDKSVTVTFETPYADWKGLFTNIMPAHILEDVTGWNESLDETNIPDWSAGPFKFENYSPEQSVTMVPNEEFWGEQPKVDEIVVIFGLEPEALPEAFENGEIDLAYPQPQVDLVQRLEELPEIENQINFGLSYEHIDFNLLNPLLADKAVRQAIAWGLDREELVARTVAQFDDRAEVLNNRIWLNNQPEYEDNAGEYATADPERAMQTLEDAGYAKGGDGIYAKDGERLSFRISTTGGNRLREDTQEVIQDQLQNIGIELTIDNVEGADVFDKFFPESGDFADADYDIALFAWVGTPFTASSNQSLFIPGGGQNEMSYENEEVGTLFTEAIQTADPEETVEKTNQIDEILWEDLPTIPLYAKPTLLPVRDSIINVVDNASTYGPLWNATTWGVKQ
jgi:peptide/nickel transport system substrate-binding protein